MVDPPEVSKPQPPNPELEKILNHLQRMNADQVIDELKSTQTEANEIKDKIDSEKEHLKMHMGKLPKSIRETEVQIKLNKITDVVKRVVVAMSTNDVVRGNIFQGVPDQSRKILESLCTTLQIGMLDANNSLFFNEIIIRGVEGKLQTVNDLIHAFENIDSLQYLDNPLYSKIASLLRTEAKEIGATDDKLERLKTEDQKRSGKKEIVSDDIKKERQKYIKEITKQSQTLGNNIKTMIESLNVDSLQRSEIGEKIRQRVSDPTEQQERLIDELQSIKIRLIIGLEELFGASGSVLNRSGTPEDRLRANMAVGKITSGDVANNYRNFVSILDGLRAQGVLRSDIYESLLRWAGDLRVNNEKSLEFNEIIMQEHQGKGALHYQATHSISAGWTPRDEDLLKVLDNKEAFKEFINDEYGGFQNPKEWNRFQRELKHIFNTLFAGTIVNPKDFWQSTFSEFREGMVYKDLTTALFYLGDELKNDSDFGDNSTKNLVKIKDVYAKMEKQAYKGSNLLGGATLIAEKMVDISLGRAIRGYTNELIDYKEFSQHSHDVNALTDAGLGWEKLDEFSSRLRQEDVDRIIRSMPGLADAISLYQTNIAHITARSGRTIPVEMGRLSRDFNNLDSIGQETFLQLWSLTKIQKRIKDGELIEDDILRMVNFAAGLSKGVFGGFYGAVGNNHIAVEITELGGNSEDPRPSWIMSHAAKSGSSRAIEKMFAEIDPDQNYYKFTRPRLTPEIRYAWAPRNIRGHKATLADYKCNHSDIYKWQDLGEKAVANGAQNELIDFEKDHKFLKDTLKTTIVDMGARAGWRYYDYRDKLEYIEDQEGTKKIDFHKTILRLQGVGEEGVKVFINDLFRGESDYQSDTSALSLDNIGADIINENKEYLKKFGWRPGQKISDNSKAKNALQELFYEKYIFQHIRKTKPSLFIAMETRSVIPEDEVRGTRRKDGGFDKGFTFHDQLMDYLVEINPKYDRTWIATHLLPLYTNALQIVEKNEWDRHYKDWEKNEESRNFDSARDPFDYKLTEAAFADSENRKSLIELYKMRRTHIGETSEGIEKYSLNDEDFIEHVKGFYKRTEEVIEMERWDHNTVKNKFGNWVHTGEKETLTHRYAKLLKSGRGGVDSYLSWNCLNLDQMHFATSGNRMTQRALSEAALFVKEAVPEIDKILTYQLPAFTQTIVKDDPQFDDSVRKHFSDSFIKIQHAVANIDDDIGWDYCGSLMMCLVTALQDDRFNRFGITGPLQKGIQRRKSKTQSSYMTDKIPVTPHQESTSLDSTRKVRSFIHILTGAVNMPREKDQVIGHEPSKFFGLIPGNAIYNKNSSLSTEQLVNEAQVGIGIDLAEQSPMIMPIFLMLMGLLAKLASDKDKKK